MEILRIKEVCRRLGISRTKLWEMTTNCEFPHPIQITKKRKGFIEAEVDAWIESRIAERDERGMS